MKANAVKANATPPQPDENFFPPLGRKLSCQTIKPRRPAIVSAVATASAETAPRSAHAFDVESLKASDVSLADMASTPRDVRFRGKLSGHRD